MDIGYHLPIRYYGPRGAIRRFSAARIIHGDLNPDDVRGQIVILGATALGVGDTFATPFDRIVPGVEIFRARRSPISSAGDGLIRTALVRKFDAGAAVLLPCVTVLLMAMRRPFAGLGLAALVFVLWAVLAFVAFLEGYWVSVAVPLAASRSRRGGLWRGASWTRSIRDGRLTADKAALTRFQSRCSSSISWESQVSGNARSAEWRGGVSRPFRLHRRRRDPRAAAGARPARRVSGDDRSATSPLARVSSSASWATAR